MDTRTVVAAGSLILACTASGNAAVGTAPTQQHGGRAGRASAGQPGKGLGSVDWANFSYTSSCFSSHPQRFAVKHGRARVGGILFQIYPPTYGHLTNQVQTVAAVPYSCTGADFGGVHVFVFNGSAPHPQLLGELPPPGTRKAGTIASVSSVAFVRGNITLAGIGYSANAPHCCPDLRVTTTYRWNGRSFVVVRSSAVHQNGAS